MLQRENVASRGKKLRRWGYAVWLLAIAGFALLHAWHLRADFPIGSPWVFDWAKFTDEGWYGNAAIRAHLFGNWYVAGTLTRLSRFRCGRFWSGCCFSLPA